jgi:hypothetical protein
LPEGMNVKQVQPVDLRGRPVGQPIPVRNGSFKVQVGAFAPVSLVLNALGVNACFIHDCNPVPEGRPTIAQRFNVGNPMTGEG